jgi:lysozyme family protein
MELQINFIFVMTILVLLPPFSYWVYNTLERRKQEQTDQQVTASTPIDEGVQAVLDTVVRISVPDRVPQPARPEREQVGADAGPRNGERAERNLQPSFAIAHAPVARIEGGYQRHAADSGNYNSKGKLVGTRWGIAAPVAEKHFGRVVTRKDMETLSLTVAHKIFKKNFWDKIRASEYPDQQVANIVYDGAVNHGVRWGIKLLQRSIGLREDGIPGPVTMAALHAKSPEQVYYAYFTARKNFYQNIVANRPNQAVFLKGWMRRLEHYRHYRNDLVA